MGTHPQHSQGKPNRALNKPSRSCLKPPCCQQRMLFLNDEQLASLADDEESGWETPDSPWQANVNQGQEYRSGDDACTFYMAANAAPVELGYEGILEEYVWRPGKECEYILEDYYERPYVTCCQWDEERELTGQEIEFEAEPDDTVMALFIREESGALWFTKCIPLDCFIDCGCGPECIDVILNGFLDWNEGEYVATVTVPGDSGQGYLTRPGATVQQSVCLANGDEYEVNVELKFIAPDASYFNGTHRLRRSLIREFDAFDRQFEIGSEDFPSPDFDYEELLLRSCVWSKTWKTYRVTPQFIFPYGTHVSPGFVHEVSNHISLAYGAINDGTNRWSLSVYSSIPAKALNYNSVGPTVHFLSNPVTDPGLCPEDGPYFQVYVTPGSQVAGVYPPVWSFCTFPYKGLVRTYLGDVEEQRIRDDLYFNKPYANIAGANTYQPLDGCKPQNYKGHIIASYLEDLQVSPLTCPYVSSIADGGTDCPDPPDPVPPIPDPPEPLDPICNCGITRFVYFIDQEVITDSEELEKYDTCVPETPSGTDPCLNSYFYLHVSGQVHAEGRLGCEPVPIIEDVRIHKGLVISHICKFTIEKIPGEINPLGEPYPSIKFDMVLAICKQFACPEEDDPLEESELYLEFITDNSCIRRVRLECEAIPPPECCECEMTASAFLVDLNPANPVCDSVRPSFTECNNFWSPPSGTLSYAWTVTGAGTMVNVTGDDECHPNTIPEVELDLITFGNARADWCNECDTTGSEIGTGRCTRSFWTCVADTDPGEVYVRVRAWHPRAKELEELGITQCDNGCYDDYLLRIV